MFPVPTGQQRANGNRRREDQEVPVPFGTSQGDVVKDSAGRYFASFVRTTDGPEVLPQTTDQVGFGLGLTHFTVLCDGGKPTPLNTLQLSPDASRSTALRMLMRLPVSAYTSMCRAAYG
ncbi:hypothetical protein [Streptomyces sp. NBC_01717]|uniref:hypothetical protein n=1 Tax=Streptomyces sp. NBC_01717 TaxID=2975918 RepID=UPI002E327B4B|nr:hypothetical protein [Streptomyces sp. NBC_01717]